MYMVMLLQRDSRTHYMCERDAVSSISKSGILPRFWQEYKVNNGNFAKYIFFYNICGPILKQQTTQVWKCIVDI